MAFGAACLGLVTALGLGACVDPYPMPETDAVVTTTGSEPGESTVNTVTSDGASAGIDSTGTAPECIEGTLGCQCSPSGTCSDGLTCIDAVCIPESCGNGTVEPENGEECDPGDGEDPKCDVDCTLIPICGDGVLDNNEECDDGNSLNDDACLNTCKDNTCGDGHIWSAQEECDDGNDDETDACLSTCENARCGDGYTWTDHEECDDADRDNNDDCLNTCVAASCGDGFVWSGAEECDDANDIDDDACANDCTEPPTEFDACGFAADDGVWIEFEWASQNQAEDPVIGYSNTPGWGASQWAYGNNASAEAKDLFGMIMAGNDPIGWVLRIDNSDALQLRFGTSGLTYDSASVCVTGRSSTTEFGVSFEVSNPLNNDCGGTGNFSAEWVVQADGFELPNNCVFDNVGTQALNVTINGGSDQLLGLRSVRLTLHGASY